MKIKLLRVKFVRVIAEEERVVIVGALAADEMQVFWIIEDITNPVRFVKDCPNELITSVLPR